MPGWKDQDTGQIVVVPGHLLLAEETNNLGAWCRGLNEEMVVKRADVEEDGLVVKKEFGKEREVLGEELNEDQ